MKKLLLLATSVSAYYLFKNKQKKGKHPLKKQQQENTREATPVQSTMPQNPETSIKNDNFISSGEYRWTFYLGPIKQVSIHILTSDYIDYRMEGKAHSTDYRIHKVSFDAHQQKWIGKTDDDLVYVLFFKEQTDEQKITLYKHKCGYGEEGIAEAKDFAYPSEDATADHGWNVYSKKGSRESVDVLPFSGKFIVEVSENDGKNNHDNETSPKLNISDNQLKLLDKTYQKLTHHLGERRWVGQCDDDYIVMFYEMSDNTPTVVSVSLQTYQDMEEAYQSKHNEQQYTQYHSLSRN